ncbi:hypothetical protein GCM10022252_72990 [Streptosporangium oxazolinicum]|uniref:Uncharacterized protein n=1 Tax=Streptosporangium oxazolinicum TaxID=909287 RepID=A0ABP8BJC4_9ACTN
MKGGVDAHLVGYLGFHGGLDRTGKLPLTLIDTLSIYAVKRNEVSYETQQNAHDADVRTGRGGCWNGTDGTYLHSAGGGMLG